ncbi:MAG: ABC-F family ATP-binding cassette domain-containing protein [Christensenella sp.]|uniref:ribosomal protection-like ABC-F family protein n=1 Tax=Christensenella sp. TaxID=1935934 RepID=UPI002B20861F|nr:ABC-F family ATP-binding cassette domain-containing protein [Christensenella sp.]MEA5003979.1 ABC-F family ATP-binding cassette domain-containing protein [Christensenella sp.]
MLASFADVSVAYGDVEILKNIAANLNAGDKIGLIGANGAGKTTLLNTLVKRILPEEGSVIHKSGLSIGYLEQNSGLDGGNTIIAEMREVFHEALAAKEDMRRLEGEMHVHPDDKAIQHDYARAQALFEAKDGYQIEVNIKKILNGMGFSDKAYETTIATLSGGEKTRLAIAKLLLMDPDLLILDEPTNHLDFKTLMWLEEYLRGYKGAVLIVSHDRYFLDKLAQKIWELEDGELTEYTGNYTQYKQLKAEYVSFQLKEYEKQSRQIAHMEDYVARNLARASTAKSAQSRVKKLSSLERISKPRTQVSAPHFSFGFSVRPVNDVLTVNDLTLAVGEEQKVLARDISMELKRGQKAAVIGDNGTGKSTLIKLLMQHANKPADVHIAFGKNTVVGYYDQENKNMTPTKTVLSEIWDAFPSLLEYGARSMLGRVLLTGENVFKRVGDLSGGERAKVGLALLMCGDYNVLLLDEPTNHLDLPAREALEQALKEYEGTLLFVSHDRYFINALAGKVYEIADCRVNAFEGTFDEYQSAKEEMMARQDTPQAQAQSKPKEDAAVSPKQRRAQEAKRRQELGTLEKGLKELEAEEQRLQKEIDDNPADYELLNQNCAQLEEIKARYETLLEQWIELDGENEN